MANAVAVEVTIAHQVEACHYTGDDGYPAARVFSPVGIRLADGREFFLPMGKKVQDEDGFTGYVARYEVDGMIARIEAGGNVVDLDHWVELDTRPLEVRFAEEAEREAMERYEMTGSVSMWR